ncbi:hypothetical protein H109_03427 [Trichophyton interdigitale MR816]|uniref:Aminoglycoside phosphotransferase domain-containing protein n=1 Tax=Trichophyton interdigitale (strain MR816) TaxID=1215338 RepID=A0A059JA71_TRIIM|nr:hypothetical protein H109_03427 [Trichophyton interdigitale MR816]
MDFITNSTIIPVPKVYETRHVQTERCKEFCIVMEYISGKPLNKTWNDLDEGQKTTICLQVNGYLAQLRELTGDQIMATDGGALK